MDRYSQLTGQMKFGIYPTHFICYMWFRRTIRLKHISFNGFWSPLVFFSV